MTEASSVVGSEAHRRGGVPIWPAHGRLQRYAPRWRVRSVGEMATAIARRTAGWSHPVSDVSFPELHAFAAELGIPERAFEGDHDDVPEDVKPWSCSPEQLR